MKNTMTHDEKIDYMRIAVSVLGYGFDNKSLDILVSAYELVLEKQGETDLKSIRQVEADVKRRADIKSRIDVLDKVSKKVG